jgi:antitoxin component YwqK of YwqJK toxin-antitoxin module
LGIEEQKSSAGVACVEYLPWGQAGLRAVCIMESRPIIIAEGGRIVIEGQYSKGKQIGEWRWFDTSGKVVRTESYGNAVPR